MIIYSCLILMLVGCVSKRKLSNTEIKSYRIIKRDTFQEFYVLQAMHFDTIVIYAYRDSVKSCYLKNLVNISELILVTPDNELASRFMIYGLGGTVLNMITGPPGPGTIQLTLNNRPPYYVKDCNAFHD